MTQGCIRLLSVVCNVRIMAKRYIVWGWWWYRWI